jgi:hypothetical protein
VRSIKQASASADWLLAQPKGKLHTTGTVAPLSANNLKVR